MAIEKRENVFLSLSINATPIVNEKAGIEYVISTILQTGTAYVDTDSNNILKLEPNPAYQQPDEVVAKYLGSEMATLVSAIEQANAAKATAETQAATLQTQVDSLTQQLAAAADAKSQSDQQLTDLKAQVETLKAANDALGGTELGQKLAKQKQVEALKDQAKAALTSLKNAGEDAAAVAAEAIAQ